MQVTTATVQRQRLASINDVGLSNGSKQVAAAPAAPVAATATATTTARQQKRARTEHSHHDTALSTYITEECSSYLYGGPFNRFALALKSQLDNEIDWACVRLVAATSTLADVWSLEQNAPALLEAIVAVLERCRREVSHAGSLRRARRVDTAKLEALVVGDTGELAQTRRAGERAGLLATTLFNLAQVGDGPTLMAQDPRVTIEATQWLRVASDDVSLAWVPPLTGIKAELLDVLDTVVPYMRAPSFDSPAVHRWPVFGSRDAAALDPLALVETCLWEELVRTVHQSDERKLVVGALRVMVQSVSWHPQLAREILELPVPRWAGAGQQTQHGYVGEMVNRRLAELLLAPDSELAGACLELLVNMVRLEAMARTLDEELAAHVRQGGVAKRRRMQIALEQQPAGSGSGAHTPLLGLGGRARAAPETEVGSEPSMLPDGLAALVALVLQQWVAAAEPLAAPSVPPKAPQGLSAEQIKAAAGRQPTEPELREACTWVLLNYEYVAPTPQQPSAQQVEVAELFARYKYAKQRQVVPHIGRALTLSEMVRVVSAVFTKATLVSPQRPGTDGLVAVNLRPKVSHIVPIPAVALDAAQQKQLDARSADPPAARCWWHGCSAEFASEPQAIEHLQAHIRGADACRWRGCNRIPGAPGPATTEPQAQEWLEKWLTRHVLVHGPFCPAPAPNPSSDSASSDHADVYSVAQRVREAKAAALNHVLPSVAHHNNTVVVRAERPPAFVLQMAELGIQVLEQLQRWADRRRGAQGESDRVRVWRGAEEVVERVAYVAALNSVAAPYAARLLAVIGVSRKSA